MPHATATQPAPAAAAPGTAIRTIGLIGGTSPHSTLDYYRGIVDRSMAALQRDEFPRVVLVSVNLRMYMGWAAQADWARVGADVARELTVLERSGCDFAAICSNTTHRGLDEIAPPAIPLLHIVDAVAAEARRRAIASLALTGTGFLMRDGFYARALRERGVETVLPSPAEQEELHRMIFDELVRGVVNPASVARYAAIARRLIDQGASALLLGCTEQAMLTAHPDWPRDIPTLDSAQAHIDAIFRVAVGEAPLPRAPR